MSVLLTAYCPRQGTLSARWFVRSGGQTKPDPSQLSEYQSIEYDCQATLCSGTGLSDGFSPKSPQQGEKHRKDAKGKKPAIAGSGSLLCLLRLFVTAAVATIAFLGCFNTEGGSSSNEDRGNKGRVNLLLREVGDSHICQGQDATGPDKDA